MNARWQPSALIKEGISLALLDSKTVFRVQFVMYFYFMYSLPLIKCLSLTVVNLCFSEKLGPRDQWIKGLLWLAICPLKITEVKPPCSAMWEGAWARWEHSSMWQQPRVPSPHCLPFCVTGHCALTTWFNISLIISLWFNVSLYLGWFLVFKEVILKNQRDRESCHLLVHSPKPSTGLLWVQSHAQEPGAQFRVAV